jgi:hypothetical protein
MTGSSRLAITVAIGLIAALTACSGPDVASPQPVASAPSQPSAEVGQATDASAPGEFCTRFGQDMSTLHGEKADRQAALADLDTLLASAPAEFRPWAAAITPWVRAQLADDSQALQQAVTASEEAMYRIATRCDSLATD